MLKTMKTISFLGFSLSAFLFTASVSSDKIRDKLLVDELRWKFLKLENDLWDEVLSKSGANNDAELTIIEKMDEFDKEIQQMPKTIMYGLNVAKHIHAFLYLYADLKIIDNLYMKFRKYLRTELQVNDIPQTNKKSISAEDLINDIVNEEIGAEVTIKNIYKLTFGEENMLWEMFEETSPEDFQCKSYNQSPQQAHYNLYNTIALAGLKAYAMVQFSLLTTKLYEKGNQTEQAIRVREDFESRVNDTMIMFRGAMEISNKQIWRCDPKTHIKGETYEEFTKLLQGHIQNEADINSGRSCTRTCNDYPYTESYGCYDHNSEYCQKMKRCNGKLIGCHFIESHMTACISPSNSPRRYDFISFNSGKKMGKVQRCNNNRKVQSWHRWFVHCSTCMCLCDEPGLSSDRFVSLKSVMADVKNNMVVTGLRFVKRKRIIHLQIQEGKLLPYGYIDNSTVRWVPVDDFEINSHGILKGRDFHVLEYHQRSMMMDILRPHEDDYIITGVKMDVSGSKLAFQINVRRFDFKNGTLLGDDYHIYGSGYRQQIILGEPDVSILSPPSVRNTDTNRYVEFTHTSFEKDAAQTTVPFFDIQPVFSDPAVPLQAAGVYFKGRDNYGGFVAPTISTYDFSKHIVPGLPPIRNREDHSKDGEVLPN